MTPAPRPESGNVLWYILIAVVLFGALSFAIAQSMRGGGSVMEDERVKISATEIVDYGTVLANAAAQLRLRGIRADAISLENPTLAGYANANCADDSCKIFALDGGGVTYKAPSADWLDSTQSAQSGYGQWVFSGLNEVEQVGTDGATAANKELIAFLPYLSKTLCIALNDKVGMTNPAGDPPQEADAIGSYGTPFTGTYSHGELLTLPEKGKTAGCFEGGGTPANGTYHYYQVLIAR